MLLQSKGVCSQNNLSQLKNEKRKGVIKEHIAQASKVSIVRFNVIIYQIGVTEIKVLTKINFTDL